MTVFTCMDCKDRYPGCHGSCETYQRERDLYTKQKVLDDANKQADAYLHDRLEESLDIIAKKRKSMRGISGGY